MQEYLKQAQRKLQQRADQERRAKEWIAHAEALEAQGKSGRKARSLAASIMDGLSGVASPGMTITDKAAYVDAEYEGTLKGR